MSLGKLFAYVIGVVTMIAAGSYLFVYLWRWEWNRALLAGIVLVAVEQAVIGLVTMSRLERLERRVAADARRSIARTLRDTAPPANRSFAWLHSTEDAFGVFLPVMLGSGLVLSALAWVVERLARLTGGRALEADLADELTTLALPEDGLVGPPTGDAAAALFHVTRGNDR